MEQGTVLSGRWALGALIGVGASGRVFRARRLVDDAPAAVKLLHPHVLASPVLRARYQREARLAASLTHSGLCRFFDAGESDDAAWIAMELLEGTSLADWLDANGLETHERLARGLRVLRSVLEPMAALHTAGIIHRDIKPDNIFLVSSEDVEGGVKLLDLGIARDEDAVSATQTGITFGTPLYMSPEQAMDPRSCAPAADVWSFGAMLYEVLSGRPPFDGPSPASIWLAALQEPHKPLDADMPEWLKPLRGLVDACLAKQPGARPADARAVAELWDALELELPPLYERMTVPLRVVPRAETLAQTSPPPTQRGVDPPPSTAAQPTVEVETQAAPDSSAVKNRRRMGPLVALGLGVVVLGLAATQPWQGPQVDESSLSVPASAAPVEATPTAPSSVPVTASPQVADAPVSPPTVSAPAVSARPEDAASARPAGLSARRRPGLPTGPATAPTPTPTTPASAAPPAPETAPPEPATVAPAPTAPATAASAAPAARPAPASREPPATRPPPPTAAPTRPPFVTF
jgi:serine/threonine-protein kinase